MPRNDARLARPSSRFRDSFLEALAESLAESRDPGIHRPASGETFDDFVKRLRRMDDPAHVAPDFVPQTTFWLVDGMTYIGRLSLRHRLNDDLRHVGGHIGYDVRPSMRRRGYGTWMLALGLDEARGIGLSRVLLTCSVGNVASRRVIEHNGGRLMDTLPLSGRGERTLHHWIDL